MAIMTDYRYHNHHASLALTFKPALKFRPLQSLIRSSPSFLLPPLSRWRAPVLFLCSLAPAPAPLDSNTRAAALEAVCSGLQRSLARPLRGW
eukprot:15453916-Alexandrium_andersonii.AAC.1